jgi:hypothetical protein
MMGPHLRALMPSSTGRDVRIAVKSFRSRSACYTSSVTWANGMAFDSPPARRGPLYLVRLFGKSRTDDVHSRKECYE